MTHEEKPSKSSSVDIALEALFDSTDTLIALLESDGTVLLCNKAMADSIGAGSPREMEFKNIWLYMDAATAERRKRYLAQCLGTGKATTFEDQRGERSFITSFAPAGSGRVFVTVRDITEMKRGEKYIRLRLSLLEFARTHSLEELYQRTLDEICELTASPIGFYHFIDKDQKTITHQAWSTRTVREFCRIEDEKTHCEIDRAGVWMNCIRENKPVIHNDYPSLEHKKGLPEGHAAVARILVAPITKDGKTGAILGVGNKSTDYTEKDVEAVSFLGGVAWEIIHLKRAEDALRRSEDRYRALFEKSPNAIVLIGIDGIVHDINDAAAELTGYSRDELRGKRFFDFDLYEKDELPDILSLFSNLAATGEVRKDYELTLIRRDGERRIVGTHNAVIKENGKAIAIQVIIRDITERRNAETALRESEMLNRRLVEHLPHRIFIKDRNSSYVACNANYARDLDIFPEQIAGRDDFAFYPAELAEKYRADDREVMAGGTIKNTDEKYVIAGKDHWVHTIKVPYHDDRGRVIGVLGIFEDITERMRVEQEHKKLEEQLRQSQKMESVGRLAGGVAHDFNNMLSVIIGNTDFVLMKLDSGSPVRGELLEIRKAAQRSANLIRQLLAFARKQTVNPKILDLNETVAGMLKMLQRLIGENIDLAWLPGRNIHQVKMDPSQIDQALANLVVNGRDAIAGVGRITIETENVVLGEAYCADHAEFVPGDYVLLSVSDNGTGMSKDILEQLFDPFFTTKEMGKGTGLGLSTVYGVVRQNNGFINVYSEPGVGTTFKIYLPRAAAAPGAALEKRAKPEIPGGTETVLLVEDEPSILNIGRKILENLGYRVLSTGSPTRAIQLVESCEDDIHLLITDVVMPEMNGREMVERLRSVMPSLKCLFMSGYTANVIVHHGVLDEGLHFIQKPFSVDNLARKVREALDE